MFTLFANPLTKLSNNYLDWSRFSDLATSNHKYSTNEIKARTEIILVTALSGLFGYALGKKMNLSSSYLTIGLAGLGLVSSHFHVMFPLINKRYKMSQDCADLVTDIKKIKSNIPEIPSAKLNEWLTHILKISLANEKHSNASLTWGKRKRLLTILKEKFENKDNDLITAINSGVSVDLLDNLLEQEKVNVRSTAP